VPGAEVAFVLRKLQGSEFLYVGHAYVHGIMEGQACERLEGIEMEEIILV
jgi:hypothetical protein